MAWTVDWRVLINGRDLTSAWAPVLIDIEVTDRDGPASDSCSLTIDDTDGQVAMPAKGDRLEVYLQGGKVFEGFLDRPQSSGSRGQGRLLKVKAKGFDPKGKAKQVQNFHMDDASLEDFLGAAAKRAGYSIKIDPALAGITRAYWSAEAESFLDLGERLARKLGGTFKIRGDKAVLAKRGVAPVGTIVGTVGKNVISWDITPRDPRASFAKGVSRWFDRDSASYKDKQLDFGNDDAEAAEITRSILADEDEAGEANDTHKRNAERDSGGGSVDLDLTVEAAAEARFEMVGARPGVDGTYRIVSVVHRANRGGGATTRLELKEPGSGAGTDKRTKKKSAGAEPAFALPRHETLG